MTCSPCERIARVDGKQRLHVEVFAPLEEFEQAHAVGGAVAPGAEVRGAVNARADGVLPFETLADGVAFEVVASGEAQEGGVHGGELFHDVDAVAVGAVVKGGREERDEAEPEGSGMRTVVISSW